MSTVDCSGAPGECARPGSHLPHGATVDAALAAERSRCRFAVLLRLLSLIDGRSIAGLLPVCDRPAEHETTVVAVFDGVAVEAFTPTCTVHDAALQADPGYLRSVKLRLTT